jgi:adenine deaminase
VIGLIPDRLITDSLAVELPVRDGCRLPDPTRDVLTVCVLERHGKRGTIGRGFVKGFGLREGALASTVGHDSHNLAVVGADGASMAIAVNHLRRIQGGFVAVRGGAVVADLPLPIAGLMSDRRFEEVASALAKLRAVVADMGSSLHEPLLQLAFLPLPVIPHLKITDLGLVDVDRFALVEG